MSDQRIIKRVLLEIQQVARPRQPKQHLIHRPIISIASD